VDRCRSGGGNARERKCGDDGEESHAVDDNSALDDDQVVLAGRFS